MHSFHYGLVAMIVAAQFIHPSEAAADPKQGGKVYRACAGCHSLEPGVHLTGPSLAGVWGKTAGKIAGYMRYSPGLKAADFVWNAEILDSWLTDPAAMVPGTYMVFRGIADAGQRADLITFLERALAEGGAEAVVAQGLIPENFASGQQPEPLKSAPDNVTVKAVRHCGDGYFVTTADGAETAFWEKNLRLKIDSMATGPTPGKPVITGSGMMGDRASLIFSSLDELKQFLGEAC